MNIGDLLRFFRKNNKQLQKEIASDKQSTSDYSRTEKNFHNKIFNLVDDNLDNLSVSWEEFILMSNLGQKQRKLKELFNYCVLHPSNLDKKEKLIKKYLELEPDPSINLWESSFYVIIKRFLYNEWSEIEQLTDSEIDLYYNYLVSRSFYSHYDYSLILNLVSFFNKKETSILIKRCFPVKMKTRRPHQTKIITYNILRNIITTRLNENDYDSARTYIAYAKREDIDLKNYSYRMHIKYLENLVDFLDTTDSSYYKKIYRYVDVLKDIGDLKEASEIENEVKELIDNKGQGIREFKRDHAINLIKEG